MELAPNENDQDTFIERLEVLCKGLGQLKVLETQSWKEVVRMAMDRSNWASYISVRDVVHHQW